MMVAVPGAYPRTRPVRASTAAIPGSLELQKTSARGQRSAFLIERGCCQRDGVAHPERVVRARWIRRQRPAVPRACLGPRSPCWPAISPLAATTRARPGPTACTKPVAESTRTTAGSVEDQVTLEPGTVRPARSRTSATNFVEAPGSSARRDRSMVTEAGAPLRMAATDSVGVAWKGLALRSRHRRGLPGAIEHNVSQPAVEPQHRCNNENAHRPGEEPAPACARTPPPSDRTALLGGGGNLSRLG